MTTTSLKTSRLAAWFGADEAIGESVGAAFTGCLWVVVVRFGDHPLIREIYPVSRWKIIEQGSRDQANQAVPELLIVGGGN